MDEKWDADKSSQNQATPAELTLQAHGRRFGPTIRRTFQVDNFGRGDKNARPLVSVANVDAPHRA